MNKASEKASESRVVDLLRDLLITSLSTAGVKQREIRKIIGCDINRVNRIAKHIEQERTNAKKNE